MNQNHDEKGRFASGGGSGGGLTNAAKERVALRALADARKFAPTRTSIRGINPPALYASTNPNERLQRTDMPAVPAHMRGIHAATAGKSLESGGGGGGAGGGGGQSGGSRFSGGPKPKKTLAQLSAMGATTAKVQPNRG